MPEPYLLSSYNYHLPPELIAQEPAHPRDSSRLMVCDLGSDQQDISHLRFHDILNVLDEGDVLVLNDSRVIPARIRGRKSTGGKTEVLFLKVDDTDGPLEALIKGRAREGATIIPDLKRGTINGPGATIDLSHLYRSPHHPKIRLSRHISEGRFEVEVTGVDGVQSFLERNGEMPVPPYIRKPLEDQEEYQTVYSKKAGSIAAPTAGLHYTPELLDQLRKMGVRKVTVTLHVSIGTFLPVRDNDIRNHTMEPEYFMLGDEMEDILTSGVGDAGGNEGGGRTEVIGVGTTVVKTLESAYHLSETGDKKNLKSEGWSDLFIYPGHEFRSPLKGMFTNFHLPSSTLIMLVSAYAGRDPIMRFYEEAVRERYRFYSFGDAMYLKGRPR